MRIRTPYLRGFRFLSYFFVILMLAASFSKAQTTTASFQGTVADATGAVLPGAQVTASNVETGLKRTMTTSDEGRFLLSELPPGSYEITVTLPGFDTLVRKGMTLTVGQQASLRLTMNVGTVDQHVIVTGDAPLVETTQSSVSAADVEKISALSSHQPHYAATDGNCWWSGT